jgi:hypothetical protein
MSNLIDSSLMAHIEEVLHFAKDKVAFFEKERDRVEDTRDGAYDYYEGLVDGYGIMETKMQTIYNRALYEMRQDGADTMWGCPECHSIMLYWQEADHKANECKPCTIGDHNG